MDLEIKLNSNQKLENLKEQIHNNEFLNNHIIYLYFKTSMGL